MQRLPSQQHGFSLVEIALALGIASVALFTVVALLGVASDANSSAGRDTTIVTMANQVLDDLRGAPSFDALWDKDPRAKGYVKKPTTTSPEIAGKAEYDTTYFFTQDGIMVTDSDAATNPQVVYQCTVKKTPDLPRPDERKGPSNSLKVQLIFKSPVMATPPTPDLRNATVIHASIARF